MKKLSLAKSHKIMLAIPKLIAELSNAIRYDQHHSSVSFKLLKDVVEDQPNHLLSMTKDYLARNQELDLAIQNVLLANDILYNIRQSVQESNKQTPTDGLSSIDQILNENAKYRNALSLTNSMLGTGTLLNAKFNNVLSQNEVILQLESTFNTFCECISNPPSVRLTTHNSNEYCQVSHITKECLKNHQLSAVQYNKLILGNEERLVFLNTSTTIEIPEAHWNWLSQHNIV